MRSSPHTTTHQAKLPSARRSLHHHRRHGYHSPTLHTHPLLVPTAALNPMPPGRENALEVCVCVCVWQMLHEVQFAVFFWFMSPFYVCNSIEHRQAEAWVPARWVLRTTHSPSNSRLSRGQPSPKRLIKRRRSRREEDTSWPWRLIGFCDSRMAPSTGTESFAWRNISVSWICVQRCFAIYYFI